MWATLAANMPAEYLRFSSGHAGLAFVGFVFGLVGMSLGALGKPHLLSRLIAVRGDAERRQGFRTTFGWGCVEFAGMVTLGLSGRALMPELELSETVFYRATTDYLPAIVAGIATAAMLVVAAGAVALALSLPDTIFNRVLFAWSALGVAFGPIVLFRVAGRSVGAGAAFGAMAAGFATTVLFYTFGTMPADSSLLAKAAHLPGDPVERVFPWVPSVAVLWFATRRVPTPAAS